MHEGERWMVEFGGGGALEGDDPADASDAMQPNFEDCRCRRTTEKPSC